MSVIKDVVERHPEFVKANMELPPSNRTPL